MDLSELSIGLVLHQCEAQLIAKTFALLETMMLYELDSYFYVEFVSFVVMLDTISAVQGRFVENLSMRKRE